MARRPVAGNLPAELSSFVGRGGERSEVRRLLSLARLVTVTGAGGVGKSRLVLRVGAELRRSFADGVWLVELAMLNESSDVAGAVSDALGVPVQSARDRYQALVDWLAHREVLLILDSCEHLVLACAALVMRLMVAASGVRILATGRASLGVAGEHTFSVPPLSVPEPDEPPDQAMRHASMQLFGERAAAVSPGFRVTPDNAALVGRVCRRLDGLPLAIELATVRLRSLSLEQLDAGLDDRFRLLTTGNRAALARHRALRASVEWSYALCTASEQRLWARISVFAGGFDRSAAEHVCSGDGSASDEMLEPLAGLFHKSVLLVDEHVAGPRYRILDTVRQYGLEKLHGPDEGEASRADAMVLWRRHRDYYIDLAERFNEDWFGPRQHEWTERMRAELPNLRTALRFSLSAPARYPSALRLAGALYFYWYACGAIREGRHWLERAIKVDHAASPERMRALGALSRLLIRQGLPELAIEPARESLVLARQFRDPFHVSRALQNLGSAKLYLGDPSGVVLLEAAVAATGELPDAHPAIAFTRVALAIGAVFEGDPVRASELLAESLAVCRVHGDQWWLGITLGVAVIPALTRGDLTRARTYARESLRLRRTLHDTNGTALAVEYLAGIAAAVGDFTLAARLLGTADRQWRVADESPFRNWYWRQLHDEWTENTRTALGDGTFDAEFRLGAGLTLDQAIDEMLGDDGRPADRVSPPTAVARLTPRERQVADLIARGLTNRQIAVKLVISQRTAESHVGNILTRFGFSSRAQIAAWYAEHADDLSPDNPPANKPINGTRTGR